MSSLSSSCIVLALGCGAVVGPPAAAQITAVEAVTAYASAWAEADEETRRALLEKAWTDDGVYMDPTALVEGREALDGWYIVHKSWQSGIPDGGLL